MKNHAPNAVEMAFGRSSWTFEREFALRFARASNTEVSVSFSDLVLRGQYEEALGLTIKPGDYEDHEHFAVDHQVVSLLSQSLNVPGVTPQERKDAAVAKWLATEEHNRSVNDRLWSTTQHPDWVGAWSSQVLGIFGPLDERALDSIVLHGKFGPGASAGVRAGGEAVTPSIKYDAAPCATPDLLPLIPGIMPEAVRQFWWNFPERAFTLPGATQFSVPKKWNIDRMAATEPLWNMYVQLGIGGHLVKRLTHFGVNLHDQTRNQELARKAFQDGGATVDLTSASDTVVIAAVQLALMYNGYVHGVRWFRLLDLARSKMIQVNGTWIRTQMFSTMGNGFTFPLETALFLALVRVCVPTEEWGNIAVYGDDIVLPRQYVPLLVERLEYLGFKVNGKKTCLAGTFFESCGTDWFKGQPVRPFFLRQDPDSEEPPVPQALAAANALRAWQIRCFGRLLPEYRSLWLWCKGQVPMAYRNHVPPVMGDVGLHVSLRESGIAPLVPDVPDGTQYKGWEGRIVHSVKTNPTFAVKGSFGVLAISLRNAGDASHYLVDGEPFRWKTGAVRSLALSLARVGLPDSESRGREPVKRLFGKPTIQVSVVPDRSWDDFNWEVAS